MWAIQYIKTLRVSLIGVLFVLAIPASAEAAINALPTPPPSSGSYGLEATKTQPPPTTGATITIPGSGASFATATTTVGGICPDGLLVQVYNNGAMVGSVQCKGGSFSLQITLFRGTNEISAIVFDNLDQAGPTSNIVTVNYNDTDFTAFGALITLTSNYGRKAASPGTTLTWPLQLAGGTGPYAFSVDWGDGKPADLKSQPLAGNIDINHVYSKSGIYRVTVKVTDVNGVSAFLQLVAISKGNISPTSGDDAKNAKQASTVTKVLWLPAAASLVLLFPTFWLGRRSELVSLHKKLQKDYEKYQDKERKS